MSYNNLPIGLDISDRSIKLVQLSQKRKKIKIQAFAKIELEEGLIVDGEIKNEEEVSKKIQKILKKPNWGQINSTEIVACLPETKTFIKLIKIENGPNKLEDIIQTEIEKYIPISIKNMYYDWQIIENKNNFYSVLIGASASDTIESYISLLNKTKLSITALEIESMATCRALLSEESPYFLGNYNKNYCLIDIGAGRSSLTIYSKNTIISNISVDISGNKTTNKIAEVLNIEKKQAEKAKLVCGFDESEANGIISKILEEEIENICQRIENDIDFFYESYPNRGDIDKIIICGGGSGMKKIDEVIKNRLLIETIIANPFTNINNFPNQEKDLNIRYTTAIGLALRNCS